MALSDDLKCLCLGESLNIYATSRIILENELSKGRQSQSKLQCKENWKRPLNPHLDRRPDHPGEFCQ